MIKLLPPSMRRHMQNPALVLHQPSTAESKMRKFSLNGGTFRLSRIMLFGFLFLSVSWIICLRIISSDQPDSDLKGLKTYGKTPPVRVSTAGAGDLSDKETERIASIRSNAIHAAAKATFDLRRTKRKERERLEELKDVMEQEHMAEQEVVEEEEVEVEYYYADNNTSQALVVGMANKADLAQIKRFVGSLRFHGFGGNIILGIGVDAGADIFEYLKKQHVTVQIIEKEMCTFEFAKEGQLCNSPYPHIKPEWSYFPMARDWITDCESCDGPVLFTTVHNVFFQRNPFGTGMPMIKSLQLYQEHWDVKYGKQSPSSYLLQSCKGIDQRLNTEGHLTSEIAIGHWDDMNEYLSTVYYQMKVWMLKDECHFKHADFDTGQAIVNFMRLSDRLPYHTRYKAHRQGIVNIVGYEGQLAYEAHLHFWRFKGLSEEEAKQIPYEGAEGNSWLESDYKLTDSDGYFINILFGRSSIIHEYNKFGQPYLTWLDNSIGKIYSNFIFDPSNPYNIESKDLTMDSNVSVAEPLGFDQTKSDESTSKNSTIDEHLLVEIAKKIDDGTDGSATQDAPKEQPPTLTSIKSAYAQKRIDEYQLSKKLAQTKNITGVKESIPGKSTVQKKGEVLSKIEESDTGDKGEKTIEQRDLKNSVSDKKENEIEAGSGDYDDDSQINENIGSKTIKNIVPKLIGETGKRMTVDTDKAGNVKIIGLGLNPKDSDKRKQILEKLGGDANLNDSKSKEIVSEEKRYYAGKKDLMADNRNSVGKDSDIKDIGQRANKVLIGKLRGQTGKRMAVDADKAGAKAAEKLIQKRNEGIKSGNSKGGNNDKPPGENARYYKKKPLKDIQKIENLSKVGMK